MEKDEARQIRVDLGLTKTQMAQRLGVNTSTVTRYESGVHFIRPSVANLYRLLRERGLDGMIADKEKELEELRKMKETA